ncbi:MAG TPA: hypothetical protein VM536_01235 [Chloroflexia bacterium]|nr:hypothetical protein [Chloroflexia bacterium]
MRTRVTDDGLWIPKRMLEGLDEVDVRWENGVVQIVPVAQVAAAPEPLWPVIADDDSAYAFGKAPIGVALSDATTNLDRYLY